MIVEFGWVGSTFRGDPFRVNAQISKRRKLQGEAMIPDNERMKFENLLLGQAQRFGLTPEEYLRKVWYHEQASRLGEYMAMVLLEQLLPLAPIQSEEEVESEM